MPGECETVDVLLAVVTDAEFDAVIESATAATGSRSGRSTGATVPTTTSARSAGLGLRLRAPKWGRQQWVGPSPPF